MKKIIINDCTLYHGDSGDFIKGVSLNEFDAMLTDPPYGINADKGFSGAGGFSSASKPTKAIERRQYSGDWDNERPPASLLYACLNRVKQSIIWGGNYFTDILEQNNFWLVWDKENTMPTMSDCELAWTNINKNSVKRINFNNNGCMAREKGRYHPTQKPVDVMHWCLTQFQNAPSHIFDPFMGSGSTGVACVKAGLKFTGVEIDKEYFDIACQRIEDAYKQPDLFVQAQKEPENHDLLKELEN